MYIAIMAVVRKYWSGKAPTRVLTGLENSGKPGKLTLENQDLENIWNFEKVRKILKYPIIKSRPGKFLGF